jgi:hypothetical protein
MGNSPRQKSLRIYRANAGFFAGMATFVAVSFLIQGARYSHGRTALLIIGGGFAVLDALILIDMRRVKHPRT